MTDTDQRTSIENEMLAALKADVLRPSKDLGDRCMLRVRSGDKL